MTIRSIEPWLDVSGIAAHLSVSKESIYRWILSKQIPCHKFGKLWIFKASQVDRWVLKGKAKTRSKKYDYKKRIKRKR